MARPSVFSLTQLVWCPLMKETQAFSVTIASIYWILLYLTLCHLSSALPHCRLGRMLEVGIDVISAYRWEKQGLERWSNLLSVAGLGEWAWPACRAMRPRSPAPRCVSWDGYLAGRPWVWLGVVGVVGPWLAAAFFLECALKQLPQP